MVKCYMLKKTVIGAKDYVMPVNCLKSISMHKNVHRI